MSTPQLQVPLHLEPQLGHIKRQAGPGAITKTEAKKFPKRNIRRDEGIQHGRGLVPFPPGSLPGCTCPYLIATTLTFLQTTSSTVGQKLPARLPSRIQNSGTELGVLSSPFPIKEVA